MQQRTWWVPVLTAISCLVLLALDASNLDRVTANWFGGASGFPLQHHPILRGALHDDIKLLPWLVVLALCALATWPRGPFATMPLRRRLQLPLSALFATALITLLKARSGTSCPWDLADYGGSVAHVSHWLSLWRSDGGDGRCFPAGHATSGFAFVGGYFALREQHPRLARWWLAAAAAAGLAFGLVQQARGAHFTSHTLWTAWLCWTVGWLTDIWFSRVERSALSSDPTAAKGPPFASSADAVT